MFVLPPVLGQKLQKGGQNSGEVVGLAVVSDHHLTHKPLAQP
jgi:hypothetical protein